MVTSHRTLYNGYFSTSNNVHKLYSLEGLQPATTVPSERGARREGASSIAVALWLRRATCTRVCMLMSQKVHSRRLITDTEATFLIVLNAQLLPRPSASQLQLGLQLLSLLWAGRL